MPLRIRMRCATATPAAARPPHHCVLEPAPQDPETRRAFAGTPSGTLRLSLLAEQVCAAGQEYLVEVSPAPAAAPPEAPPAAAEAPRAGPAAPGRKAGA